MADEVDEPEVDVAEEITQQLPTQCVRCKGNDIRANDQEVFCGTCGVVIQQLTFIANVEIYKSKDGRVSEHGTFVKQGEFRPEKSRRFVHISQKVASQVCLFSSSIFIWRQVQTYAI